MVTALVLGAFLIYFSITVVWKHRKYFDQQRKHLLQEIEILEADRNRIAHDLHDELGPALSLSLMQISKALSQNTTNSILLEQASKNIRHSLDRMGDITRNLRSAALTNKGVEAALRQFVKQVREVSPMVIDLQYNLEKDPPDDKSMQLFRVVQELVNNAVRHSNATYLLLRFRRQRSMLYFLYRNNGRGLQTAPSEHTGLGLTSIRNRVQLLGGKLQTRSDHENGTEHFFQIPLS